MDEMGWNKFPFIDFICKFWLFLAQYDRLNIKRLQPALFKLFRIYFMQVGIWHNCKYTPQFSITYLFIFFRKMILQSYNHYLVKYSQKRKNVYLYTSCFRSAGPPPQLTGGTMADWRDPAGEERKKKKKIIFWSHTMGHRRPSWAPSCRRFIFLWSDWSLCTRVIRQCQFDAPPFVHPRTPPHPALFTWISSIGREAEGVPAGNWRMSRGLMRRSRWGLFNPPPPNLDPWDTPHSPQVPSLSEHSKRGNTIQYRLKYNIYYFYFTDIKTSFCVCC